MYVAEKDGVLFNDISISSSDDENEMNTSFAETNISNVTPIVSQSKKATAINGDPGLPTVSQSEKATAINGDPGLPTVSQSEKAVAIVGDFSLASVSQSEKASSI
ncbi:PREDICTED: uncharacterized protein LOC109589629, partial [Amphimedon queenslandica]|uniref:Uncharacterized protein n=1 Tax=Amphimedon queenslandica TaxID=400682 RepID=A0AAN0JWE6_AMPQE